MGERDPAKAAQRIELVPQSPADLETLLVECGPGRNVTLAGGQICEAVQSVGDPFAIAESPRQLQSLLQQHTSAREVALQICQVVGTFERGDTPGTGIAACRQGRVEPVLRLAPGAQLPPQRPDRRCDSELHVWISAPEVECRSQIAVLLFEAGEPRCTVLTVKLPGRVFG